LRQGSPAPWPQWLGEHPHRPTFSIGTLPAPHRQNIARKSQPPNPAREIFRHGIEETTGKNVSAAKKIARDAKKVPKIRAKSDIIERLF
jgi:hypothetical protein